jgi:hypothetical protein
MYALPFESATDCTVRVASFQPTTTTFKLAAVWTAANGTATDAVGDCGVA